MGARARALWGAISLALLLFGCAETRLHQSLDDLRSLGRALWESAQGWGERAEKLQEQLAENPRDGAVRALLGVVYLKRRRYAEAREAFGRAVAEEPALILLGPSGARYRPGRIRPFPRWARVEDGAGRDLAPLYLQAVLELGKGRYRPAARVAGQILDRHPGDPMAGLLRAEALLGLGQLAEAALLLGGLQKKTDAGPLSLTLLGEMYLGAGNYPEAVRHLKAARAKAPGYIRPLLSLGRAHLALKAAREAAPILEEAARRLPASAEAQASLAEAYLRLGRLGPAAASWKRAADLAPRRADYRLEWARTLGKMGSVEHALAQYAEAARLAPREPAAALAAVDLLARSGRLRESIARAREGARRFPTRAHLFHNRAARSLLKLDEAEAARGELQKSLTSDPSNGEARRLLAQAYEREGKVYLAAKHLRRYAELHPQAADAKALAKRARELLARLERELAALAKKGPLHAVARLRELLRGSPGDPFLNMRLGERYRKLGFLDRAEEHLRRAVEGAPKRVDYRLALAGLYIERGRLEEAQRELEKARLLAPESRAVALERGLLELRRGRLTEAEALLEMAHRRGPPGGRATMGLLRAYALRGEVDRALSLLLDELLHLRERERLLLRTDPAFSPLWRDARFERLMGRPAGKGPGRSKPPPRAATPFPPAPPFLARVFLDGSPDPIPGRVRVLALERDRVVVELIDLGGLRRVYKRRRVVIEPLPKVGGGR